MKTVTVDWTKIRTIEDFYDTVFSQTGAPSWHGRNLNAIADSWIAGGICSEGPPFRIILRSSDSVSADLRPLSAAISKIAEESARENQGEVVYE
ncbi:MAG: barstar family protein [Nibricoccus sp.]